MNFVEEIKKFVKEECEKSNANYKTAYELHFVPAHKIACELADEFDADKEIIEIAVWLHDIGSIIYGRENHHITGAEVAEKKLKELNYPEDKIEKVKECILNHRGSKENENKRISIEAKIIAEADILDSFDNIAKQFLVTLVYEKKPLEEAKKSVVNKLKNKWSQIEFESSRQKVKNKFEAAMLLFKDG